MLGDGIGVHTAPIGHADSSSADRLGIELIVPGTADLDKFQPLGGLQKLVPSEAGRDDDIRVGDLIRRSLGGPGCIVGYSGISQGKLRFELISDVRKLDNQFRARRKHKRIHSVWSQGESTESRQSRRAVFMRCQRRVDCSVHRRVDPIRVAKSGNGTVQRRCFQLLPTL